MALITPQNWTKTAVISPQALLITNRLLAQLDLSAAAEAVLKVDIARISTVAYTNPVDVDIYRIVDAKANLAGTLGSYSSPNSGASLRNLGLSSGLTASGSVTRVVNTTSAVGDTTISLGTSNAGSTAHGSTFAFLGATAPGSLTNGQAVASFEVAKTSGFTGTGPWTHKLDAPLGLVHTANDYVTDAVETLEFRLPGGCVYNINVDCYNIAAGAGCVVHAIALVNPGWQSA